MVSSCLAANVLAVQCFHTVLLGLNKRGVLISRGGWKILQDEASGWV